MATDTITEGAQITERDAAMGNRYTRFDAEKPRGEQAPEPSSGVEFFLAQRREEYAGQKHGKTKVVNDIMGLLNADMDDISKRNGQDHKNAKKETDPLLELKEVLLSMTAQEKVDDKLLEKVGKYLVEKTQADESTGGHNQETLQTFLRVIPNHLLPDDYQTTTEKETNTSSEQVQLPEYSYKPGEKIKAFFAKYEDTPITSETAPKAAYEFVNASLEELEDGEIGFDTENSELIAAIDTAQEFLLQHKGERDNGKFIQVVMKNGKPQVGWEGSLKDTEGPSFRFDPRVHSDSVTLGDYVESRRQYTDKIEGTDQEKGAKDAIQLLKKLVKNPDTEVTQAEYLPVSRIFDRHKKHIEERLIEITNQYAEQQGNNESRSPQELIAAAGQDPETTKLIEPLLKQADILTDIAKQIHVKGRPAESEQPGDIPNIPDNPLASLALAA